MLNKQQKTTLKHKYLTRLLKFVTHTLWRFRRLGCVKFTNNVTDVINRQGQNQDDVQYIIHTNVLNGVLYDRVSWPLLKVTT